MRVAASLLLVAACGAGAAAPATPRDTNLPPGEARYRALTKLLANADSTADLVPQLPEDLRANFTLVFATRSAQTSVDPVHPRVVMFGTDARLIVAFTGDPHGRDLDTVEVLRFRDDTRAFELAQFVLPAAVRRDPALAAAARDNGAPNPRACLKCHGSDPRPIFDTYPVWPGFYGSAQDGFAASPTELADYRAFQAARDADPTSVYRGLIYPPGSSVSPYALADAEDQTGKWAPNMRFGMALTERNRARIARMLEASPRFLRYRDKLVAGLLGCEPLPIDSAARGHVLRAIAAEDAAKLDRAGIHDKDLRHKLRMTELASAANVTELDYLARVLDVSRADWSMALEPGALALYDGILSGRVIDGTLPRDFYIKEDFLYEMLQAAAIADPATAPVFGRKPYAIHGRVGQRLDLRRAIAGCRVFAARAAATPWPATPATPPYAAYRCVRCHEPGGDGPEIPFDRPAQLRATPALRASVAARLTAPDATARMPLDEPALSAADQAALLDYLQRLE